MLQLPDLHDSASRSAGLAKRAYLELILASLLALTGASVAGEVAGKVAAVVAVALFTLAIFLRYFLVAQRPERTWYDGRVVADSVKTLAWLCGRRQHGVK